MEQSQFLYLNIYNGNIRYNLFLQFLTLIFNISIFTWIVSFYYNYITLSINLKHTYTAGQKFKNSYVNLEFVQIFLLIIFVFKFIMRQDTNPKHFSNFVEYMWKKKIKKY